MARTSPLTLPQGFPFPQGCHLLTHLVSGECTRDLPLDRLRRLELGGDLDRFAGDDALKLCLRIVKTLTKSAQSMVSCDVSIYGLTCSSAMSDLISGPMKSSLSCSAERPNLRSMLFDRVPTSAGSYSPRQTRVRIVLLPEDAAPLRNGSTYKLLSFSTSLGLQAATRPGVSGAHEKQKFDQKRGLRPSTPPQGCSGDVRAMFGVSQGDVGMSQGVCHRGMSGDVRGCRDN